jgi:hypothetical protein
LQGTAPVKKQPVSGIIGYLQQRQAYGPKEPLNEAALVYNHQRSNYLNNDQGVQCKIAQNLDTLIENHDIRYSLAIQQAKKALHSRITRGEAQAAFNAVNPLDEVLRLAYRIIWRLHPKNRKRKNFDEIPMQLILKLKVSRWGNTITLNLQTLANNPQKERLQQELIHLACCHSLATQTLIISGLLPHNQPLKILSKFLRELNLNNNKAFSDADIILTPELITLSLNNCSNLTKLPLVPSVAILDISQCLLLNEIPELSSITALTFDGCRLLKVFGNLPRLDVVTLDKLAAFVAANNRRIHESAIARQ